MSLRFSEASCDFLISVISRLLAPRLAPQVHHRWHHLFSRILIEASTVLPLDKRNAPDFPGNGNGRGSTAGCKVQWTFDLLSGRPIHLDLQSARTPDQLQSEVLPSSLLPGDLVLRDMGYFVIDSLQRIENQQAYWISRLPASTTLTDVAGRSIETLLRHTQGNHLDCIAFIGRAQHPCRVVATRLSAADTAKARRARRSQAKRHQVTPSKNGLLRDSWRLLVTNLPIQTLSASDLNALYNLRWSIEIRFRGFKQSCQVQRALAHRSNVYHLTALILAAVIFKLMTAWAFEAFSRRIPPSQLSYEKLCDCFVLHLTTVTRIRHLLRQFRPDSRHICRDKRSRSTLYDPLNLSLT